MLSSITAGLGTAGSLVSHGLHPAIGVEWTRYVPPPPERFLLIAAEGRLLAVEYEQRTVTVAGDVRFDDVDADAREALVHPEPRMVNA